MDMLVMRLNLYRNRKMKTKSLMMNKCKSMKTSLIKKIMINSRARAEN